MNLILRPKYSNFDAPSTISLDLLWQRNKLSLKFIILFHHNKFQKSTNLKDIPLRYEEGRASLFLRFFLLNSNTFKFQMIYEYYKVVFFCIPYAHMYMHPTICKH